METSGPQVQPESAPPSGPEITPQAPKPKRRKMIIALVVVAILIIAALATFAVIYLGTGSVIVTSTSQFVPAGGSTSFTSAVTTPLFVSSSGVAWNFGDGQTQSTTSSEIAHTFANAGNYLVLATASLSNGKTADNSQGLFPVQVGAPPTTYNPLGTTSSLGALSFNDSLSSSGAPFIAAGDHIAFVGAVAQPPTLEYDHLVTAGTYTNYTWQVTQLKLDFGDGSTPLTNASADPIRSTHTFANAGIYATLLQVTTGNFSSTNGSPPVATGETQTTTVGLTVAVGNYHILRYSGNVINPGIITNMEAVTGGYTTLDPALDYESTGFEVIANVYETLLAYNGTSTSDIVPVIATQLPTVANGMVSPDFMNYTFQIRPNLKYSNGDNVTAWDVKYSITRTMLLNSGSPFPNGWIISQFFVPGTFIAGLPDAATTFSTVNDAITVDNATQTVSFHLISPAPPLLFDQVVADPLGASVVDHLWLESVGPKLTWTPAGFVAYEDYSFIQNYVGAWRNGAIGSGPFAIDYVANPDSVVLKPNPMFKPTIGVPAPTVKKVVLQYVADPSTRELSLESGQADIAGIPSSHFDVVKRLQGLGLIQVQFMPTLNLFWWNFNLEIYQSAVGSTANPYGNQVPPDFFVDLNMRKAFAYAYNYGQYFDQILGNKVFNATFGIPFNGIVPKGMIGYEDLSSKNVFSMALAQGYYNQTQWVADHGWATSGFTVAINVETADTVDRAEAAAWAQNIESLAPGITVLVKPISFEEEIVNSVPHLNPMGIYFLGWLPDYPFPTDYTLPMLLPADSPVTSTTPDGGTYPNANGYNIQYLAADPNGTNQVTNSTNIRNWILDSINPPNATNVPQVVLDSQQAQRAFADLWYYVPAFQQFAFFAFRTWITGMANEQNPTLGGADLLYNLITKPSTTTTSSVRGSYVAIGDMNVAMAFVAPLTLVSLVRIAGRFEDPGRKG